MPHVFFSTTGTRQSPHTVAIAECLPACLCGRCTNRLLDRITQAIRRIRFAHRRYRSGMKRGEGSVPQKCHRAVIARQWADQANPSV
jgi:hypothetical protein